MPVISSRDRSPERVNPQHWTTANRVLEFSLSAKEAGSKSGPAFLFPEQGGQLDSQPVVHFDVYDTSGKLHQVFVGGKGGTLELPQDVAFDYQDGATDIHFRKTIRWRVIIREVV